MVLRTLKSEDIAADRSRLEALDAAPALIAMHLGCFALAVAGIFATLQIAFVG